MRLFTKINQEAYAFKKYGFLRDAIYLIKAEADPSSRWYLVFFISRKWYINPILGKPKLITKFMTPFMSITTMR